MQSLHLQTHDELNLGGGWTGRSEYGGPPHSSDRRDCIEAAMPKP